MTGASFKNSLEKLAPDMYESLLDARVDTLVIPELREPSREILTCSRLTLRSRSGERGGRTGPVEVVGDSEVTDWSRGTRAIGMTLLPSVPAVWIEV